MPFPNEHAARQKDPRQYASFRRYQPSGFPNGIEVILGITRYGKTEIQSIRANAAKFTAKEFRAWLERNNFDDKIEEATDDKPSNKPCIEFLRTVPTESVELIIVDPPYYKIVAEKWDNQWDTEEEYLNWCVVWLKELQRILKPQGVLYIFGTTKTNTFLRLKLQVLDKLEHLNYNNWIIWHYEYGGKARLNFSRKHEDILMYSKSGNKFMFNADDVRIPYVNKKNPQNKPGGKIPTGVWFKNKAMSGEDRVIHPTQKPLAILRRIIKAHTKKGATVLDCFSGSGATMIASHQLGRHFIGCEKDIQYYAQSLRRLEKLRRDDKIISVATNTPSWWALMSGL